MMAAGGSPSNAFNALTSFASMGAAAPVLPSLLLRLSWICATRYRNSRVIVLFGHIITRPRRLRRSARQTAQCARSGQLGHDAPSDPPGSQDSFGGSLSCHPRTTALEQS